MAMASEDSADLSLVAILRFLPDGTVEMLNEVDVAQYQQVQLHSVSPLGSVLVLGEPDSSRLFAELDRIAATPTLIGQS